MINIKCTLDTKYFLSIVDTLEFKEKDELEAQDIMSSSSGSVKQIFRNANNRWAEHYIITDTIKNKIICVITLDINNGLNYFVTVDLDSSNTIVFIKSIKSLVKETIVYRHVIFVTTKLWYKEALKFNRIIGFKVLYTNKGRETSTWFFSNKKGY